jgi:anion-transporting  ArsA/GET3 family ATPase
VNEHLSIDDLLDDMGVRTILCCGSGGVGKTTTAAALGVRAAQRGRHVVVLTIDPARRLAQSLGVTALGNEPRVVDVGGPGSAGSAGSAGSLHAMQLDMKRTFDEIVEAHAEPERAQQILANPFYQSLSSSFAGTQEYMAMEKLGQLHERIGRDWDLVIVDTPPSRSALDFLDAPRRLGAFLDGRLIRLLAAPARLGGRLGVRVVQAGFGVFGNVLQRILGSQVLTDIEGFVSAFDTLFSDVRARADHTHRLLQQTDTRFLVVATPERDALREAAFFVERLQQERMPLGGLILNRLMTVPAAGLSREQAIASAERLSDGDQGDRVTAGLLLIHADRVAARDRQEHLTRAFLAGHPRVAFTAVPELPADVHDVDDLARVGALLSVGMTL